MNLQHNVDATLAAVSQYSAMLEGLLANLPLELRTTSVLAVQELLVNIVRHGYSGAVGQIVIGMALSAKSLEFKVRDDATTPFSMPDTISPPDPLDLPENGMGLFIIQQAFDHVHCERIGKSNHWTLIKHLGG